MTSGDRSTAITSRCRIAASNSACLSWSIRLYRSTSTRMCTSKSPAVFRSIGRPVDRDHLSLSHRREQLRVLVLEHSLVSFNFHSHVYLQIAGCLPLRLSYAAEVAKFAFAG